MTLLETGRTKAKALLRYGFSDEQVRRRTGASFLEVLELRAEAAVGPARGGRSFQIRRFPKEEVPRTRSARGAPLS